MKTKEVTTQQAEELNLSRFPNFASSGSITGMKIKYYGKDALLIKAGNYIYNVSSEPEIYHQTEPRELAKMYFLTLQSDSGKHTVRTYATSAEAAKMIVCKANGCPESAIIKIK